jgi:acyl dehydratase
MGRPAFDAVAVGETLPSRTFPLTRLHLVRYAGASGDFIAHGMLTMATAARLVSDWAGDPGAVVEYGVRFTKPVVVPDDDRGAELEVSGVVTDKDEAARTVRVDLTATSGGSKVLGRAQAVVRLS